MQEPKQLEQGLGVHHVVHAYGGAIILVARASTFRHARNAGVWGPKLCIKTYAQNPIDLGCWTTASVA